MLVSAITAKSIRTHRSPDQYLHKISAQMPDLLPQQQIPEGPELWTLQNFHKLAAARTAMIADDATDLVSALQQGWQPLMAGAPVRRPLLDPQAGDAAAISRRGAVWG